MKRAGFAAALITCLVLSMSSAAQAGKSPTTVLADGTERTTYTVGPLDITSGQNRIAWRTVAGEERPAEDGWITHITPNLVYADGSIPSSSKIMFHHGVWFNAGNGDQFYATGEEKTDLILPPGYGYRYKRSDGISLNHMIHNLVPEPTTLYITYTIDFVPDTSPMAASIKPVRPIWTDVQNGSGYPVFDVLRDSGGSDGEFVYPQDDPNAYPGGWKKNEVKISQDGVLVATTGHVHTGGLSTNLYLKRPGAEYAGGVCDPPQSYETELKLYGDKLRALTAKQAAIRKKMPTDRLRKLKKSMRPGKMKKLRRTMKPAKFKKLKREKSRLLKKLTKLNKAQSKRLREVTTVRDKQRALYLDFKGKDDLAKSEHQACLDSKPSVIGDRVHLFESAAKYFEPAGPVSWDMAMMSTADDWRVEVERGDTLELQTTYETERASWYESMGINIVYWSPETDGDNPYKTKVDKAGVLNHGHYPENDDHGGGLPVVGPDPDTLPDGLTSGGPFQIGNYSYQAGDFRLPGAAGRPPVVKKGESFSFKMSPADEEREIWHSLTSCKSPCNKSTGIAYPIADGEFQFDSGQLGSSGAPTVGRSTWTTPANLPVGTHTYFCRIHPLMRGAFRVVD